MELTKNQLQYYVDELPIGYYANTRLPIMVDEKAETSYFVPAKREIYISLSGVNQSISNIDGNDEDIAERSVRAHLYHELSHALLTPKELQITDIMNTFEDERIETLLRDYYMKVNFRENIKALCGYKGEKPTREQTFFYAVRFRVGRQEWLERIDKIISKYRDLNWSSGYAEGVYRYDRDVYQLYSDIMDDMDNNPISDEEWQNLLDECGCNQDGSAKVNGKCDGSQDTANGGNGEGESEGAQAIGETDSENVDEGETVECEGDSKDWGRGAFEKALENAVSALYDQQLYNAVEQILVSFKKRNSKGSSMNGYSGHINPRNCGREDYKFFDRKATVNGANPYGTMHLNLFIDDSGSFQTNAPKANQIINTMSALADKYKFFTVDFALCGDKVERVPREKAYINAMDGTFVQDGATEIVRSMQKKNTCVYNIVLYDGRAGHARTYKHPYIPFDLDNATLVLDNYCKTDAEKVQNAKVILVKDGEYCSQLTNNIIRVMQSAFR